MRQAIVTKFLGPTNTKGGRVRAVCDAASVTVGWDHRLNQAENHYAAMVKLCNKLGWPRDRQGAGMPRNGGYCWVEVAK